MAAPDLIRVGLYTRRLEACEGRVRLGGLFRALAREDWGGVVGSKKESRVPFFSLVCIIPSGSFINRFSDRDPF
jgi:hypothetical protein